MALAPRIRKALRLLAFLLALLLALVTVPLVAMQLPAVRGYVLEKVVQQAKKSLPGELQVRQATWPSAGKLLLQEVHWVDAGDTLARIDVIELHWKPWGLALREIHLPLLEARVSRLDLPRIQLALSAASPPASKAPNSDKRSNGLPWFHQGAVRGMPSMLLEDVRVDLTNVQVADSLLVESLQLRLQSDLRAGKMPNFTVQQLQVKLQDPAIEVSEGRLKLDLQTGQLEALIHTSDGSPWALAVTSNTTEADQINLAVQVRHADGEPLSLLTVQGDLLSRDERVVGVRFSSQITTPGVALLRQMPALRSSVAAIPDLQGIQLNNEGELAWLPSWRLDVSTQVAANDWLQGGQARLHFHDDSLVVSDVELRLADVSLKGDWSRAAQAMRGQMQLHVEGTGWMSDLLPNAAPPDSLALDLSASLQQHEETLGLVASLRAGLVQGNLRIDDVRLEASATSLEDVLFRMRSRAAGWDLAGAGRVVLGDSLLLFLEPLQLQQARGAALAPWSQALRAPKGSTRITWQAAGGLRVVDLGVTGDLGDAVLGGFWQADQGGEATLRCSWPRPPAVLLRAIADSALAAHIERQWTDEELPLLEVVARLESAEEAQHVEAQGRVILPGPRLFAAVLPESIQVQDLNAIRATFAAQYQQDSLETTWNASLDLNETAWLDSSGVVVQGRNDSLFVESLRLLWDGLDLRLAGAADSAAVDLAGSLQFDANRFVARLPQKILQSIDLQAAATWQITGAPEAPDIDSQLQAKVDTPWGSAPTLLGAFEIRKGILSRATVDTPEGVAVQELQWQQLHVDLRPETIDGVDGSRIRVTLAAEQQELRGVLWLDASPDMKLQADTLYVRVFDRELLTDQPFFVEKHAETLQLRDLQLSGSLGVATADMLVGADTLSGLLNLDLQLPDQPDLVRLPEGTWPRSLRLRAAAADNDSLTLFLQASGLQIGNRPELSVVADIHAMPDSTHFRMVVVDPQARLLEAQGHLPVAWSLRPLSFAMRADSLRMQATFNEFPIPDVAGDPRAVVDFLDRVPEVAWAHLNGTLQLAGPVAEPRGHGYWTLQLQDPALKAYKAHVFLGLAQRSRSWSVALQNQLERLSTGDILSAPGAKLAVWVQRDSVRIVDAAAHLPVTIGFENSALKIDSGANLRAAVRATEVKLSDLNSLLPPRTELGGVVTVALQADGPWQDPQLSGGFKFKDLSVRVADGSRVRASGNIDLQGTARDPGVQGQVHVQDGLIRIPEIPRALLPVEGEALLLANAAVEAPMPASQPAAVKQQTTQADSSARSAVSVRRDQQATLPKAQRRDTQAVVEASGNNSDVFVRIPGAFWIRGRGFEVELSGNLQLTVREGHPRVVGELKAERGDLQLMASKFPVKSGRVLFFGDDETNPSLDLVMGRKYGDVSVEIVVQGTAKEPIIEFRSEPQLTEDEILSYVLFGRGTSQLDATQTQRYDERVLALASLLTANLGEGISSRAGIDMVGLEQSAETADRAALVVGKYLSPRVLLKYVLDLERGQGYALNVEYWLKGGLRLMTTTSRYNQSGMELNWSHDY